jgi:flagellar biogenesis protein FliO
MCTILILIVVAVLVVMRLVTGKSGLKGMSASA